ncbi:type II toxin-antitoxin system PemK/MazF family toxin [Candidatus Kaiserbacteria bacterium]|nr:type II toxin-antitoxin system PemK/MazF family toxin [Candidatus Kaiserbacteria bacterium]
MGRVAPHIPDRGDVVWISFSPRRGHEQKGRRPALVLSTKRYTERSSFMFCCPITSRVKGYPFEVPLALKAIRGVVLADQAYTFDCAARSPRFIGKAPDAVVQRVGELVAMIARGR